MTIFLAILAGTALGYILERGDFCFHSTLRGLFQMPRRMNLFRAYLLTLLIAIPLVQGMIALGWIEPWIAPFAWQANLFGGILFGIGMVVASTCVTGLFYKLGHGMLGVLVGLITWGIGDILTYKGPLSSFREVLNQDVVQVDGAVATVFSLLGPFIGFLILIALSILAITYLWRSPRGTSKEQSYWGWLALGATAGIFTALAWLLATLGGSNYTFGTSYVPTSLYDSTVLGAEIQWWIPASLFSIILGAFIAAIQSGTLWVRGETTKRYLELGAGGLLMGSGAAISGGCNLGHGLVGVSLLSVGSIVTVLAMTLGVFIAHHVRLFWMK